MFVVNDGFSLKASGGNVAPGCNGGGPGIAVPKAGSDYDYVQLGNGYRAHRKVLRQGPIAERLSTGELMRLFVYKAKNAWKLQEAINKLRQEEEQNQAARWEHELALMRKRKSFTRLSRLDGLSAQQPTPKASMLGSQSFTGAKLNPNLSPLDQSQGRPIESFQSAMNDLLKSQVNGFGNPSKLKSQSYLSMSPINEQDGRKRSRIPE